jgi:hypothetical protein
MDEKNEPAVALRHPYLVCESDCNYPHAVERFDELVEKSRKAQLDALSAGWRTLDTALTLKPTLPPLVHTRHVFHTQEPIGNGLVFRCTVCGGKRVYGRPGTRDIQWT